MWRDLKCLCQHSNANGDVSDLAAACQVCFIQDSVSWRSLSSCMPQSDRDVSVVVPCPDLGFSHSLVKEYPTQFCIFAFVHCGVSLPPSKRKKTQSRLYVQRARQTSSRRHTGDWNCTSHVMFLFYFVEYRCDVLGLSQIGSRWNNTGVESEPLQWALLHILRSFAPVNISVSDNVYKQTSKLVYVFMVSGIWPFVREEKYCKFVKWLDRRPLFFFLVFFDDFLSSFSTLRLAEAESRQCRGAVDKS